MDFGAIFRKAFKQVWQYKSLWIFGLFASGMADVNHQTGIYEPGGEFDFGGGGFMDPNVLLENIIPLISGIFILVIIMWTLSVISTSSIIDACNKISRGGQYKFADSFSVGLDFFWRMAGLSLVIIFSSIFLILAIVLVGVLFGSISKIIGGFYVLGAMILAIPSVIFISALYLISMRSLVLRNNSIGDALSEGYDLVMNNKKDCFLMIVFSVLISFVVAIGTFIFSLPFIGFSAFDPSSSSWVMGASFAFFISLIVGGFFGAFLQNAYTLFYLSFYEDVTSEPESIQPQTN